MIESIQGTNANLRPYPIYLDVDLLDKMPENWEIKKLIHIASSELNSFVDGPFGSDLKNEEYQDSGVPLIQLNNIRDGRHISNNLKFISEKKAKDLERHIILPGQIAIAKMADPVARAAIVNSTYSRYVVVADCVKFAPNDKSGFAPFIVYSINSPYIRYQAELLSTGTTRLRINLVQIKKLRILLPSLSEQHAIAAFLNRETAKIDALIAKKERLIELLQEKRAALISHAVTKGIDPSVPMKDSGVEWLGEIPEHWKIGIKLSRIANEERNSFVNGPFGSDLLTSELKNEGVPVIYIRDIKLNNYIRVSESYVSKDKANELDNFRVDPKDVLVAKVGDPPGTTAVYPENEPVGIVTQDVIRIKINSKLALPIYISHLFNSKFMGNLIDTISIESTRTRISLGSFKQLRIMLPSVEEQKD
ncbi:MAG: restriction endonuclease subunit S, partial [Methanothrix sp.]|nr:restriction endonuclease subunit S [Methanothrix sp.]